MYEEEEYSEFIALCQRIAGKEEVEAICMYGSRVGGYARKDSDYDVLLILTHFKNGVRYFYRTINDKQYAILTVDKKAIEMDVETGNFGDFIAGRLISPYRPILNSEYLENLEIKVKKRFTEEELQDLVIEYEELARGLVIKPEYLILARMKKRVRGYPPLRYSYMQMLKDELRDKNMHAILAGYRSALKTLHNIHIIKFVNDEITLENSYVDKVLSSKILNKVVNFIDSSKRALSAYITHGRAGRVKLDVFAKELTSKLKRELKVAFAGEDIEDPKNYLFLRTEQGLVNLNEQNMMLESIQQFAENQASKSQPLSSALNDVFLVTVNNEKYVVKKFTNWYNVKWFILNIAAYGTKMFALSGKARLANEYGINRLLASNKMHVPDIVTISLKDRMLVQRFIPGINGLEFYGNAFASPGLTEKQKYIAQKIGTTIAEIHALDIAIGDCKPENFVITDEEEIFVLDLEQGERKGDKTWDIAEFLYFSGHFGSHYTGGIKDFVKCFIDGYCIQGKKGVLRKASNFRYSRVFLGWTAPPIIQSIASTLKAIR
jgi:tRNA A-37 threonylcarbamoyl transferase component Bud32/predicted nucleotidyltransferase